MPYLKVLFVILIMVSLGKLLHFLVSLSGCFEALSMIVYRVVGHDCFMILHFTCDSMLFPFLLNNDQRQLQFDNLLKYYNLLHILTILWHVCSSKRDTFIIYFCRLNGFAIAKFNTEAWKKNDYASWKKKGTIRRYVKSYIIFLHP